MTHLGKALGSAASVLAMTLALGACGQDSVESAPESTSQAPDDAPFNDADVTFAQGMIPHHQQAVTMAQMADERAESEQVKDLAERIEAAQAPEIEQLGGWLEEWGAEVPSGTMDHEDMGHGDEHSSMAGMMTEEQMEALGAASGADWDAMFLTMMIEHHEGAVEMARTETEAGENPEAIALAERIISAQEAEIEEMERLLAP